MKLKFFRLDTTKTNIDRYGDKQNYGNSVQSNKKNQEMQTIP